MNKYIKGAIAAIMGGVMLFAVGCKKDNGGHEDDGPVEKTHNTEERVLQLSTLALDGNFNPFFYTSGNDGSMVSLTQLGMLTLDESGSLVYGEDQACVTLDYKRTLLDASGNPTANGSKDGFTDYEFIIKNGIKFSDGHDLTIKDVLFTLYVYLDPAYTGSSTIYSTDIVGLTKYRTQNEETASDSALESQFTAAGVSRVNDILKWIKDSDTMVEWPDEGTQLAKDIDTVKRLFKEEVESDWTAVSSSFPASYEDSFSFTEIWQAYLYNEGIITTQTRTAPNGAVVPIYDDKNGNGEKDDGELYYTTLDAPYGTTDTPEAQGIIEEIKAATTEAKINEYIATHSNSTREYALLQLQKEYCTKKVYDSLAADKSTVADILNYWATGSNVITEFANDARKEYFDGLKDENGKLKINSIDGITTYKTSTDFKGGSLGEQHDVLKIRINGIDPKAEFNFAFSVVPLHYYSGTYNGVNYVTDFNGVDNFGVATADSDFFKDVLKATGKNGLPLGAGPYKASNSNGTPESSRENFYTNGVVYFMRNDNFHTVGDGINDAKIKYINYKELTDDRIMEALQTQAIDFGMPNATAANVNLASQSSFLSQQHYRTGGYGYVGVNPKFFPEYPVRQAIMKALDTSRTAAYYEGLAEVVYRPMSTTSWAYPKGVGEHKSIAYTTVDQEIRDLVESAGYGLEGGIYTKKTDMDDMANAPIGTKLEFPFTIAGNVQDHPAMQMFRLASQRLNNIGFKTLVKTDAQALRKMNTGNLEVWAAAWQSALDPDPYQIYHKDSKATSPNNWNYPQILSDPGKWSYEYGIIDRLSGLIEEGRETLVEDRRIEVYAQCLDLIMELAVELPTYQRDDLCVYNNTVIDGRSLVTNPSYIMGLFDKIWEIDYV